MRYVDVLWNRIFDLEAQIDDLKEQNDDLRQQMQRERGNEEVVNIGSSYDPTCCCANPSCICTCHYNDGQHLVCGTYHYKYAVYVWMV